jgi:CRP-like cAMP-binding protein
MNPGELFGEIALISTDNKRTATVMAKDRCDLLEIDREVFDGRMAKADPLLRFVMEHLTRRLAQLTDKVVHDHAEKK